MLFSYEAYTRDGERVRGTVEADRMEEVNHQIFDNNLIVSKIKPLKITGRSKVKPEELIVFTRLLATAVNASIPLTRALEITMEELPSKSELNSVILSILHQLKIGKSLSEALHLYQNVFSELYISMVRAGEKSGKLGQALNEVLKYLTKRFEMKKKISASLLYPTLIVGFSILILVFFVVFLIPRFKESYSQFGGEMPQFTQSLLNVTDWLKSNLWVIALIIAGIVYIVRLLIRTEKGRRTYENFLFSLPVVGELYKKDVVARLTRTLSVLLSNGVTLVESLELTEGVVSNRIFQDTIRNSIRDLSQGKSFTGALKENKYVPAILTQMVAMGEESGRLAPLLENLSDFYEREVDISVDKITSVITPVMIMFIGLIIGVIVVGLFLPIFNISSILE